MEVTFSARVSAACTHAPRLFCPASALFLPDGSMAKNLPVTQETMMRCHPVSVLSQLGCRVQRAAWEPRA